MQRQSGASERRAERLVDAVAARGGKATIILIGGEGATIAEVPDMFYPKLVLVLAGKAAGRVRIVVVVALIAALTAALSAVAYFGNHRVRKAGPDPVETHVLTKETRTVRRKIHLEDSGPVLTIKQIEAFEREIGGRLPDDYKDFLLAHNGGFAEPEFGFLCKGQMERIDYFQRLLPTSDEGLRHSIHSLSEVNPANAGGFLPIAHGPGDKYICLAYRGDVGAVFYTVFKYKKVFRDDFVPVDVTMAPLAGSFTEFLDSLVEIPDPYCRIEDLGKRGTADDLAQYLVEGNSINAKGKNGLTILREAIRFDNSTMIRACIERGASLSGSIEQAVKARQLHLIEMLVKAGADINERDEYGDTPLHDVGGTALPGEEGARNRELRDLLMRLGAIDPCRRVENLSELGTPADLARYLAEGNSIDAVGEECDRSIVCEAIYFNNVPMVEACIEQGASLRGTIHIAVENMRTELIEMLACAGADVNERNEFGSTPLYYVLLCSDLPGEEGVPHRELRDLLVKLGAVK